MEQVSALLKRAVLGPYPWWLWPSGLVALAAVCVAAALAVYPPASGDGTTLMALGQAFGGECGMKVAFGVPCPQCGMTRSWVYLVRGDVLSAFQFNAAGALLLLWIAAGGLIGALRLVTGREGLLRPPWVLLFGWSMFWVIVPYMGLWAARLFGFNMLPEYLP